MAASSSESVHLAHVVTDRACLVTHVAGGCFTAPNAPGEYVIALPGAIELRQMSVGGATALIRRTELHSHVQSIATVTSTEPEVSDALAVTADNGRLVILRYDRHEGWLREAFATYGKSGIRRPVPGVHLAVDPRGRAAMVAAYERGKLLFPLRLAVDFTADKEEEDDENANANANEQEVGGEEGKGDAEEDEDDVWKSSEKPTFRIGSCIDASDGATFVFSCVALDNPVHPHFACLEHHRGSMVAGEKAVVVYEHNLGIGTAVKLWTYPTEPTTNILIAHPRSALATDGAVLACGEDVVLALSHDGHSVTRSESVLPRRHDYPFEKGGVLVSASTSVRARNGQTFMILQNDLGDLFRVVLTQRSRIPGVSPPDEPPQALNLRYLDTLPPAAALHLSRHGYLYAASETDDHVTYKVTGDGPKDDTYLMGRRRYSFAGAGSTVEVPVFERRGRLDNLSRADVSQNLAPVVSSVPLPDSLRKSVSDALLLSGRAGTSTAAIRQSGHAAAVSSRVSLPSNDFFSMFPVARPAPAGEEVADPWMAERHEILVVTAPEGTMTCIPSDNASGIKSDPSIGFVPNVRTLAAAALSGGAGLVQVHTQGLRHVTGARDAVDWQHGFEKKVRAAAVTPDTVLLAFEHGGLYHFELDEARKRLEPRTTVDDVPEALCVAVAPPRSASEHSQFAGIGRPGEFVTVRFTGERPLVSTVKRLQCFSDPVSAAFVVMPDKQLYAFIGLTEGVILRLAVDPNTASMVGVEQFRLGNKPITVSVPCATQTAPHVFATNGDTLYKMSMANGANHVTPVAFAPEANVKGCTAACDFSTVKHPGHIAVLAPPNTLALVKVSDNTTHTRRLQASTLGRMTARRVVLHPSEPIAVILLCEQRGIWEAPPPAKGDPDKCRPPLGADGAHAWRLVVVDLVTHAVRQTFDPASEQLVSARASEAAVSMCVFQPPETRGSPVVVVGCVPNFVAHGAKHDPSNMPMLRCFELQRGAGLRYMHATTVAEFPASLTAMGNGLLFAGTGVSLRCYAMSSVQLLQKTRLDRIVPNRIQAITATEGNMLAVADVHETLVFVKYYPGKTSAATGPSGAVMVAVADHYVPRHVVSVAFVDPMTCALSDRFGNVAILRVPMTGPQNADALANDLQGDAHVVDPKTIVMPPTKALEVASMHVGATVVSLSRISSAKGPVLTYQCSDGQSGALVPITSLEFSHCKWIVNAVRDEAVPLVGREHERYRSTYGASHGIVDVDYALTHMNAMTGEQRVTIDGVASSRVAEKVKVLAFAEGRQVDDDVHIPSALETLTAVRSKIFDSAS